MSFVQSMRSQTIGGWAEEVKPQYHSRDCASSHSVCRFSSSAINKRRLIARTRSTSNETVAATSVLPGTTQASDAEILKSLPVVLRILHLIVKSGRRPLVKEFGGRNAKQAAYLYQQSQLFACSYQKLACIHIRACFERHNRQFKGIIDCITRLATTLRCGSELVIYMRRKLDMMSM